MRKLFGNSGKGNSLLREKAPAEVGLGVREGARDKDMHWKREINNN